MTTDSSNFSEQAKKARRNARIIIYGELLFVLLPFVIGAFIAIYKNELIQMISSSDWSLAATILTGQTLFKFVAGLFRSRRGTHWQMISVWIALLLIQALLCLLTFAILRISEQPSLFFSILQIILFSAAFISFIVFGGIGQRLLDISLPERT